MHICGIWKKHWYRWSYLQSSISVCVSIWDTDIENKHMETKGMEGGWDELGNWDWCIYTIDTMYKIDN